MCVLLQIFSVSACLFLKEKLLHTIHSMSRGKPSIVKVPELKDFCLICEGSTEAFADSPAGISTAKQNQEHGILWKALSFQLLTASSNPTSASETPYILSGARNLNSLKMGMEFATPSTEAMLKLPLSKVVLLYQWHFLAFSPQQTSRIQVFGPGALLQKTYYESSLSKFHKFRL